MRSGIGGISNTLIKSPARNYKDARNSLAALIESVWNANDLFFSKAAPVRLRASLDTLDTRLLGEAEKGWLDLEDTLLYACHAFECYRRHRGITMSREAVLMLTEHLEGVGANASPLNLEDEGIGPETEWYETLPHIQRPMLLSPCTICFLVSIFPA